MLPPPGRNSEGSCLFLFNIKNPTVESLITPLVLEQPTLFTRSMFGRNSKISREPASKWSRTIWGRTEAKVIRVLFIHSLVINNCDTYENPLNWVLKPNYGVPCSMLDLTLKLMPVFRVTKYFPYVIRHIPRDFSKHDNPLSNKNVDTLPRFWPIRLENHTHAEL